jgi:SAM-dependent methyltransferase
MSDDVDDIRDYYDRELEHEEQRLVRHRLEFELTLRYLDAYLPERANILELGAATGRYTLELVKRGHRGTAVDLSAVAIERCRERIAGSDWRTVVADARTFEPDEFFDVALVMGPMYHLVERGDRAQVLGNVRSCLVESGLCFSSWICRHGILGDLLRNIPEWIENDAEVASVLEHGYDPPGPREGFRGYFARADEVASFHEEHGFETLAMAAAEPAISADDESYNRLEGERRAKWLDLLFAVSREPSIIGASRHLLYVGRKR